MAMRPTTVTVTITAIATISQGPERRSGQICFQSSPNPVAQTAMTALRSVYPMSGSCCFIAGGAPEAGGSKDAAWPRGGTVASSAPSPARAADDAAEHAADDGAADVGADRAHRRSRRGFGQALVLAAARAGRAEDRVLEAAEHAAIGRWRDCGRGASGRRGDGAARRRAGCDLRRRRTGRCAGTGRDADLQFLVRRFAVDRLLVDAGHERASDERLAFLGRDRADAAGRRHDEDTL